MQIKLAVAIAKEQNVTFLSKAEAASYIKEAADKEKNGTGVSILPVSVPLVILPVWATKELVINGETFKSPITYGVNGADVFEISITCFRQTSYIGLEAGKAVITKVKSLPIPETVQRASSCVVPFIEWSNGGKVVTFGKGIRHRTVMSNSKSFVITEFAERNATTEEVANAEKILNSFKKELQG